MVLAGIVLYNPEIERLKENIKNVINQVDKLILIDNASDNISKVEEIYKDVTIIKNSENLGIGYALKQIMEYAQRNNYDWALTLDQDSVIKNNLVENYLRYINIEENIGILTCNIIDRNFNEKFEAFENKEYVSIKRCITSASFMSVKIYSMLQGYNAEMFIDMVDWDICAQFIENGYKIIRINFDGILHEVGKGKNVRFLWMKWISFNHSAFREYYISRNRFYLCKKHPTQYKFLVEFFRELKSWIIILLYEDSKIKKIKAKTRGIMDYKKLI